MKKQEKKNYRLGIDMGSTSIGWCMLEMDKENSPCGIINMGVRIFPDGRDDKSKVPLSVARRTYRGMRRNLDRYLDRRKRILDLFDEHGFLPIDVQARKDIFIKDPIILRKEALDRELSLTEFARAIIHLAKHRGFKSNRKIAKDKETSVFKEAIQNLENLLKENKSRTLGEYLSMRNSALDKHQEHHKKPVKFRYEKNLESDDRIFPNRDMVMDEFNLLWDIQSKYHNELSDDLKEELSNIIFYQRPLKPQEVGKCTLEPEEKRCRKAYPLFQEVRIRQEINALKLLNSWDNSSRFLTNEEKEIIYKELLKKESIAFKSLRTKILGKVTADDFTFNTEAENKDKIKGNQVYIAFHKDAAIGELWDFLPIVEQNNLINAVLDESIEDDTVLLILQDMGLNQEQSATVINLNIPDGYGNLSYKALNNILPYLREGYIYSDACEKAGYNHSGFYNGVVYDSGELPYYGELLKRATLPMGRISHDNDADQFGKINNPTVHIALNQLRKIINALTIRYGAPFDVNIELAREIKLGLKQNEEINRLIGKNTKANEKIAETLSDIGIPNSSENRLRYKLWGELNADPLKRCCIYSGKQISLQRLYSDDFEIEHILPKSRTFDDNITNKTIATREANRDKKEQSPYDAFGHNPGSYNWQAICERASSLPANKRWRFHKEAMEKFTDESKVLDRMLNDTKYMSRIALEYLQYVTGKKGTSVNGKLTEALRRKWDMNKLIGDGNKKDRSDHRHHAIDAFVISLCDPVMVKRYATAIKKSEKRFLENLPNPYPNFSYDDIQQKVDAIMVSFKPDQIKPSKLRTRNQTGGGLMKETAYGYIGVDPDNPKFALYSIRTDVLSITAKDIEKVADAVIKTKLIKLLEESSDEKDFKQKLPHWAQDNNIKKVKLIDKANPNTMVPVKDKNGKVFKYYASDENLYADIYNPYPFKPDSKWQIEIIKSYDLHQDNYVPNWKKKYPTAKLIMRVYKNDVIAYTNNDGKRELRRIRKMSDGKLYLRELQVSKKIKGQEDIGEAFYIFSLQKSMARKAGVDVIGRFNDPLG